MTYETSNKAVEKSAAIPGKSWQRERTGDPMPSPCMVHRKTTTHEKLHHNPNAFARQLESPPNCSQNPVPARGREGSSRSLGSFLLRGPDHYGCHCPSSRRNAIGNVTACPKVPSPDPSSSERLRSR